MSEPSSTDESVAASPAAQHLFQFCVGAVASCLTYIAAKLAIPDHLKSGPKTLDELAAAVDVVPAQLRRVLRGLAFIGIVEEAPDGRFAIGWAGHVLRSDLDVTVRDDFIEFGSMHAPALGGILESLRSGEPAFDRIFGMNVWQYRAAHPDMGALFHAKSTTNGALFARALLERYDFAGIGTMVDVGGGHGAVLRAIIAATPDMRGVLYDLPDTIDSARKASGFDPLDGRLELVGGDFFDSVPKGGDCYLLRLVLHNWDDEQAARILRRCREAMSPGARVLVIDAFLPEHGAPAALDVVLGDIEMLALERGRERTQQELTALIEQAGLEVTRAIADVDPVSGLLEARAR